VQTCQLVHLDDLTTPTDVTRGTNYVGSSPAIVRHTFGLLPVAPAALTLVDLGCGPGRVVMLAAEAGFGQVIGWDIGEELVAVGRDNLERFRRASGHATPARIEVTDATSAPLPDGPCVLHFFSPPYPDPVLAACLRNAHRSYLDSPRDLFLILVNDHNPRITEDFPFLSRVEPSRSRLRAAVLRWLFSANVYRIGRRPTAAAPRP
jgi:SAM-dependent methyltransferase